MTFEKDKITDATQTGNHSRTGQKLFSDSLPGEENSGFSAQAYSTSQFEKPKPTKNSIGATESLVRPTIKEQPVANTEPSKQPASAQQARADFNVAQPTPAKTALNPNLQHEIVRKPVQESIAERNIVAPPTSSERQREDERLSSSPKQNNFSLGGGLQIKVSHGDIAPPAQNLSPNNFVGSELNRRSEFAAPNVPIKDFPGTVASKTMSQEDNRRSNPGENSQTMIGTADHHKYSPTSSASSSIEQTFTGQKIGQSAPPDHDSFSNQSKESSLNAKTTADLTRETANGIQWKQGLESDKLNRPIQPTDSTRLTNIDKSTPQDKQSIASFVSSDVRRATNDRSDSVYGYKPRIESAIQLPGTRQSTGRSDTGSQLPEGKQSTGRSDTGIGGASRFNVRPDTRNDANTAKLPDAKALAGLDQKFGDKLNPPGKSGGIPVVLPGLPDVLGGFKGDRDVRGGKGDTIGSRDGKEALGSKDSRGDATTKDGKTADGKSIDGKNLDGKHLDGKNPDGKNADGKPFGVRMPDGKLAPDGRPIDGRQQGGSNLTDAHRGDKTGPFVLPPGSLPVPDLVNGIRTIGQNLDPRIGRPPLDGTRSTPTEGVKTAITGSAGLVGDTGRKPLAVTGNVGDGVKTSVTGSHGTDRADVKNAIPLVPPPAVQLGEMVGNLKAIAAKIFPPDGRTSTFDNNLPGRRTERLDTDITLSQTKRAEPLIPISRALGGDKDIRDAENFVIRLPQGSKQDRITVTRTETNAPTSKDAASSKSIETNDTRMAQSSVTGDSTNKTDDKQEFLHDEAAEKLLVNFELVGADDSQNDGDEAEKVFSLSALEQFGDDFEKSTSDEDDDVAFDGDAAAASEDEQDTRYQYIVEAGDTVEMIAIKVFKNVTLAPLIYDINKESIPIGMQDGRMSFILKIGTIIWLPFPKEIKAYLDRTDLGAQH